MQVEETYPFFTPDDLLQARNELGLEGGHNVMGRGFMDTSWTQPCKKRMIMWVHDSFKTHVYYLCTLYKFM